MLRLASQQDSLSVIADESGHTTHAGDLLAVVRGLVAEWTSNLPPSGTYRAVGGPVTRWHGFVDLISHEAQQIELIAKASFVRPITTTIYRTIPTRPLKLAQEAGATIAALVESQSDYRAGVQATLLALSKP